MTTETKPDDKKAETKAPAAAPPAVPSPDPAAQIKALQDELSKLREQKTLDISSLSPIVAQMVLEARQSAEAEIAPIKAEMARYKVATQLGLNEAQADKVLEFKAKNPGLTEQQALLLARVEHQDVFPQPATPAWNRGLHGGLPVSGQSMARDEKSQDHTAMMHEAVAKKDWVGANEHATQAFVQRVMSSYPNVYLKRQ